MDNLTPWKEALKERTLYGCFVTYGLPDIAEVTALMALISCCWTTSTG